MNEIKRELFQIYERTPQQTYNIKQAMMRLDAKGPEARKIIQELLNDLCSDGLLEKVGSGDYQLTRAQMPKIFGKVDMTSTGMAYIIVENAVPGEKDIIVESRNLNQAMNGDRVEVVVTSRRRDGRKEGEIVSIVEKARRIFVGRLDCIEGRDYGFVVIDSKRVPMDIFVPEKYVGGAKHGQKVMVEAFEWPKGAKNPTGKIIDVLGNVGDNNTEMHAILAEYDLPYAFPEELEKIASNIPTEITKEEIGKRRDMRKVTTFTIDPADAKDFDDALSIEKLSNGNYEIGVHIADVTHYVKPGDEIDTEALDRATSVYLVDRTVPMLPESLSNFLCSLRPNEDKLCFSAIFEITTDGQILNEWFGRTVIHSDRRFSYEEAQEVIENKAGDFVDEILTMDSIAKILRAERFKAGSIGFERDEAKFILDENGKPEGVYFKQMKDSNQLIEEYMLLANRMVAKYLGGTKGSRTSVYRIHDQPNEEKFAKFKGFISRFGFYFKHDKGKALAKELTAILQGVKDTPQENIVSTLAIRSMAKATYTTQNIGHYGLAFDHYTHFTSPIRRYPDMMVHRLLQHYLDGGKTVPTEGLEEQCEHSAAQEIKASSAERDSIKYKMVEFMEDKIGEEFDGVISGVTDWGIYVELIENKIEGMVSLRDIEDDYYSFDDETYSAVGHRNGRRFTLGDKVRIAIKKADLQRKQLDFKMVGTIDFETGEISVIESNMSDNKNFDLPRRPSGDKKKKSGAKKNDKKKFGK